MQILPAPSRYSELAFQFGDLMFLDRTNKINRIKERGEKFPILNPFYQSCSILKSFPPRSLILHNSVNSVRQRNRAKKPVKSDIIGYYRFFSTRGGMVSPKAFTLHKP